MRNWSNWLSSIKNFFFGSRRNAKVRASRKVAHKNNARLTLEGLEDRVTPATLLVGFGDPYTTIGAAVGAATSGDTIQIAAGTYQEQVSIVGKNLTLIGAGQGQTIIQAPASLTDLFDTLDPFNPPSTDNNNPVVGVNGGIVTIQNLTVDGLNSGSNYGDGFEGIGYNNASGTIDHVTVVNISNTPFNGDQNGVGIFADNDGVSSQTLTVTNNNISGYQKNGMALNGTGLNVDVENNTVTGAGQISYPLPAQNGIQVSFGAGGIVNGNTVTGDSYFDNTYAPTATDASGILIYDSAPVSVTNNMVSNSDLGIGVVDTTGSNPITGNTVTGSFGAALLIYEYGDTASFTISGNSLVNGVGDGTYALNTGDGIDIYGDITGTTIQNNLIENNTGTGIYLGGTVSGDPVMDSDQPLVITNNTITGNATENVSFMGTPGYPQGTFELDNESGITVNANGNFWNTYTPSVANNGAGSVELSSFSSPDITVQGAPGVNSFNFDFSGGNIVTTDNGTPLSSTPASSGGTYNFVGNGTDTLTVDGSGSQNVVYTPGASTGTGTVVIDGTTTIDFSGLSPVVTHDVASGSIVITGTTNDVSVSEQNIGGQQELVVSGTSDAVAFEQGQFYNISGTVTIDTTAGTTNYITITSAIDLSSATAGANIGSVQLSSANTTTIDASGTSESYTWTITGTNTGSLYDSTLGQSLFTSFTSVQDLVGSSGTNNTFVFDDGAYVTGSIDGGSGATASMNFSAYTQAIRLKGTSSNAGSFALASAYDTPLFTFTDIAEFGSPSNYPVFPEPDDLLYAEYDGYYDTASGAITLFADQPGDDLQLGQSGGNVTVTVTLVGTGTDTTALLAAPVDSINLIDDQVGGVTFDVTGVLSSAYTSLTGTSITVTGFSAGQDTLAANSTAWTINGHDSGTATDTGFSETFTNVANLVGGSGSTFTFGATGDYLDGSVIAVGGPGTITFAGDPDPIAATVSGSDTGSIVVDSNMFNFYDIQNLTGGTANNTYAFSDGGELASLNGGTGTTNTLNFGGVAWLSITADITAANAGSVSVGSIVSSFTHIQTLDGSAIGGDTYKIENGASLNTINGGSNGDNTLSYPSSTTGDVSVDLSTGIATGVTVSFTNITAATNAGTGSTNTLDGTDGGNYWTVSSANAGSITGSTYGVEPFTGAFAFSGFNVLNAGAGGDTFEVVTSFSGSINGSTGSDALLLDAGSQSVSLSTDSTSGFTGTVGAVTGGFTAIDVLTGTGSNALTGLGVSSLWSLGTHGGNQYNDNTTFHQLIFSGFQTLDGGNGGNEFDLDSSFTGALSGGNGTNSYVFVGTSVLTGSIVGGTSTDTLDYSSYVTNPIAVVLSSSTVSGYTGTEATSIHSGGFSGIDVINGASANTSDSLTGYAATLSTWDVVGNSSNTYNDGSETLTFSNIANLHGSTGTDQFNVSGAFSGNISGGTGTDTFAFIGTGSVTGTVTGGSTTPGDTLTYSAYSSAVSIVVTSATTTTGAAGTVVGTIGGGFSGITNFIGSAFTDSLKVNYSYTSAIWTISGGAGGTNTFTDITGKTFNFNGNIENLTGHGGDTFNVTVAHTGNLAESGAGPNAFNITATLTGNITGGTGQDTVTITSATVTGSVNTGGDTGGPGDILNLVGTGSVGGTATGGTGTNTLSYNGYTAASVLVNLATGSATGIDGGAASGFKTFTNIVGANSAGDTLTGPNTVNTWAISTSNQGTITGGYTFSAFKNLVGGTSTDTFNISGSATESTVNGGAGTNTLNFASYTAGISPTITGANAGTISVGFTFSAIQNLTGSTNASNTYTFNAGGTLAGAIASAFATGDVLTYDGSSPYTTAITVSLTTVTSGIASGTATGIGTTFSNIKSITGGTSTSNTLNDPATTTNVWTISGSNSGNIDSVLFANFQNLTGRATSSETFSFTGGSVTGKVNGGGTATLEELNYSGLTSPVIAVNLALSTATDTGGFSNINNVAGSTTSTTNSLTGANVANTWNITATNAGNITSTNPTVTFTHFEALTGGSSTDNFVFSNAVSVTGPVNGGAGTNSLSFAAYTATAITADITSSNAGTVAGFSFSSIQTLIGGGGNNQYVFSNGQGLTGTINGGSGGRNTLDYRLYTTSVTVNLTTGSATNVDSGAASGVTHIQDVYGSSTAGNSLTGDGGADILVGGAGNDTIIAGTGTGNAILIGGGGKDTITGNTGWDILIGGTANYSAGTIISTLDLISGLLSGVGSSSALATAMSNIQSTYHLSANVTSTSGDTVNNGTAGNDWDIINVVTTLTHFKAGDIETFV